MKQKISESSKRILTKPLKSWSDQDGNKMYRIGDLPVGVTFALTLDGNIFETINYPKSSHTGKRQCKNNNTGKFEHLNCTKKVYIVSEEVEK
jgi:hypothetical protein